MHMYSFTGWIRRCMVGLVSLGALSASAATVPWSQPSGSTASFDYSNGQSDNGLFGSPTVAGTTFIFTPSNFKRRALTEARPTPATASRSR